MEEQALYRGILCDPHDDTPRLVYADWLDENADRFSEVVARSERVRAEFIRVQCRSARLGPGGWKTDGPADPALAERQKRLLFRCGTKWRRAFPISLASSPFDRGFLRPLRSLRPDEFIGEGVTPTLPQFHFRPVPALAADSTARRYVPDEGLFLACPLWDVHLLASRFAEPDPNYGQYGDLLARVADCPHLERVGWLKVSFFRAPVVDLLRRGNFANVETLILNTGPLPEVLEAVVANESFRSLRYVWTPQQLAFGSDVARAAKLREANERHVPHGEMRIVLRALLRDLPAPPAASPSMQLPIPQSLQTPTWGNALTTSSTLAREFIKLIVGLLIIMMTVLGFIALR